MKNKRILLFGIFMLVEVVLLVTRFGISTHGILSITILQIPVIFITIYMGLSYGLCLAGVFGIGTMLLAGSYGVATLDYLFTDVRISLFPRLMISVITWAVYRTVKRAINDYTLSAEIIASGLAAMAGTITNTVCVITSLCVFYPTQLGISRKMSAYAVIFKNVIGANTIIELVLTVLCVVILILCVRRKENYITIEGTKSIRRTFQKWLAVFMVGAFLATMFLMYLIQTVQGRKSAEEDIDAILVETKDYFNQQKADILYQVGLNGDMAISKDGVILYAENPKFIGKTLVELGLDEVPQDGTRVITISGVSYLCKAAECSDVLLTVMMPESDVYESRNETAVIIVIVNMILFIVVFVLISKLLQDNVVERIYKVNNSLALIQKGNLDETVDVKDNKEFSDLSDGINATVKALKKTMEEVTAKMNQEMEFARQIQLAALPLASQVITKFCDFEITGTMEAAREVGGDFYDYFLIGDNKVGFVIADVSGKGVPAALFMMTAKTMIKNFASSGKKPAEVLSLTNNQLCENNDTGMFVTAWLGVLNYKTGKLEFSNAGHNPPLIKKKGMEFMFMDHKQYKRSIMLGIRREITYYNNVISFTRGDLLYLYTDGVTEANNLQNELYGEDRLLAYLKNNYMLEEKELLTGIRSDIDCFAGDAKQFDDITMIVLKGQSIWRKLKVNVANENSQQLCEFAENLFVEEHCSSKSIHQMLIILDEIYSNVIKYSKAKIFEFGCGVSNQMMYMIFIDDGIQYNPLEEKEPDIHASREHRAIGGLGLYMVKQMAEYTEYQYKNERNILTIGKKMDI